MRAARTTLRGGGASGAGLTGFGGARTVAPGLKQVRYQDPTRPKAPVREPNRTCVVCSERFYSQYTAVSCINCRDQLHDIRVQEYRQRREALGPAPELPRGMCPTCRDLYALTKAGRLRKHRRFDGAVGTYTSGHDFWPTCEGTGQEPERMEER